MWRRQKLSQFPLPYPRVQLPPSQCCVNHQNRNRIDPRLIVSERPKIGKLSNPNILNSRVFNNGTVLSKVVLSKVGSWEPWMGRVGSVQRRRSFMSDGKPSSLSVFEYLKQSVKAQSKKPNSRMPSSGVRMNTRQVINSEIELIVEVKLVRIFKIDIIYSHF